MTPVLFFFINKDYRVVYLRVVPEDGAHHPGLGPDGTVGDRVVAVFQVSEHELRLIDLVGPRVTPEGYGRDRNQLTSDHGG